MDDKKAIVVFTMKSVEAPELSCKKVSVCGLHEKCRAQGCRRVRDTSRGILGWKGERHRTVYDKSRTVHDSA